MLMKTSVKGKKMQLLLKKLKQNKALMEADYEGDKS